MVDARKPVPNQALADLLDAADGVLDAYTARFNTPNGFIGPIDTEVEKLKKALEEWK